VEEIKRLGRRVILAFFGEQDGLNPELRRSADVYVEIDMDRAPSE
jgi:uncharacterized LabA/DUF88 family protein